MPLKTNASRRRSGAAAAVLALLPLAPLTAGAAATGGERLYVSDETGGNVVIIDPQQAAVVARIAVGKRPRGIVISPDRKRLYVALTGSPAAGPGVDESKLPPPDHRYDGIGVIDLASQRLVSTYPSGIDPETFALSHDGKVLYVSNEDSGQLSAHRPRQGQPARHGAGRDRAGGRCRQCGRPPRVRRLRDLQRGLRGRGRHHEGAGADPDRQAPARDLPLPQCASRLRER